MCVFVSNALDLGRTWVTGRIQSKGAHSTFVKGYKLRKDEVHLVLVCPAHTATNKTISCASKYVMERGMPSEGKIT